MTEFSAHSEASPTPSREGYAVPTIAKFKRIGLACFLCGMAACISVTLIGVILLFLGAQLFPLLGFNTDIWIDQKGFGQGLAFATIMAAMNWYVAYFTVPAAWIAIGFSLGRFPRRGIVHAAPYYRWGAIWGAFLVGSTTGIASFLLSSMTVSTGIGGLLAGLLIGGLAGMLCGALFRSVVRPAEQVRKIQVDVF